MEKFWMVWIEGKPGPTYKHPHKSAAVAEAGRLYNQEKRRAYVLEVVGFHDSIGSSYRDSSYAHPDTDSPPIPLNAKEIKLAQNQKTFIAAITAIRARTKCSLVQAKKSCDVYKHTKGVIPF